MIRAVFGHRIFSIPFESLFPGRILHTKDLKDHFLKKKDKTGEAAHEKTEGYVPQLCCETAKRV